MKYSLRSLMLVVTLVCVALGSVMGRVEYLRLWAVFHDRIADKLCEGINVGLYSAGEGQVEATLAMVRHDKLSKQYKRAVYRPWVVVDETQELKDMLNSP